MPERHFKELRAFANKLANAGRVVYEEVLAETPCVAIKTGCRLAMGVDRRIEERLRIMINISYPSHGILGEAFGPEKRQAEFVWVLDPIDGRGPFAAGLPVFGTLIGLVRNEKPLIGVADHPMTRDRWIGSKGKPTLHNGRPVRTRENATLPMAMLSSGHPEGYAPAQWRAFRRLRKEVGGAVYGGGCLAYAMLASGRIDLGVDCGLDLHDMLPLVPIIEGAGGVVTNWAGDPIDLYWQGSVVAAGSSDLHRSALRVLTRE